MRGWQVDLTRPELHGLRDGEESCARPHLDLRQLFRHCKLVGIGGRARPLAINSNPSLQFYSLNALIFATALAWR